MPGRSLTIALTALLGILILGTFGYMHIEGWNFVDSLWMVVITLTTIGFGEVHPLSSMGRVFTLGLIVAGVSVGTYTMTRITEEAIEGRWAVLWRQRRRQRSVDKLNGHYIVVGYGQLGKAIVEELHATGVPVCVIERSEELGAELERRMGYTVVVGDGSTDEVLKAAGIQRARGLAVAVSSGPEAVYVTLSARELNPQLYIITRAADSEHAVKARRAGASSVVSPHSMGGWRMAHGLVRPHTTSFLDLATLASHEDIRLEEYEVPEDSPMINKTIGELRVSEQYGALIVALRRRDGSMIPTPRAHQRFFAGDVVIVIGPPVGVGNFGQQIMKGAVHKGSG